MLPNATAPSTLAAAAGAIPDAAPPGAAGASASCDVLVVGGGPAGSTAAALLAQQGRRVVLLEKAHHPRFHIGESLLPGNVALFDKLGVREQVEAIGMPKFGIEFVSPDHDHRSYLEFADAWDGASMPSAWQVRRSELDELLFRNAAARGATTVEGCRVRDIAFDADGATVQARMDDGSARQWRAAFVLDASGRDTLLSTKFKLKERNPRHNSSALFGHYTGARRLSGQKEGNISILWFDHGWFWFIPLADGTTSVGAVCWPYYLKSRDKPLREFFEDTIALCPELADRLKDATLQEGRVHATGNYSYTSARCSGDRFLLLGDAFTFIDPMFSSGVYLAMQSAFQAADAVAAILDTPTQAARARAAYESGVRHGPDAYSWIIFRSTNPTIRDMFMHPRNTLRVKEALLSLLAGDIYGIHDGPPGSPRAGSPIGGALRAFKLIYYAISLRHARRSWRGWRRRQHNIRDTGRLRGETIQDAP